MSPRQHVLGSRPKCAAPQLTWFDSSLSSFAARELNATKRATAPEEEEEVDDEKAGGRVGGTGSILAKRERTNENISVAVTYVGGGRCIGAT